MFLKKVLRLAIEAVKVEIEHWRTPRQPDGHVAWLEQARASELCSFCREPKPAGRAFCRQCSEGMLPKRAA